MRTAALLLALAIPAAAQERASATPHAFFDRTNLALFSADALVRTLDAQSTRRFMTNPCGCFHEDNVKWAAGSNLTQYSYSLGVSAAILGAAYVAHRRGYHRLERVLPMLDIVYDGRDTIHNYRLTPPAPAATFNLHQ